MHVEEAKVRRPHRQMVMERQETSPVVASDRADDQGGAVVPCDPLLEVERVAARAARRVPGHRVSPACPSPWGAGRRSSHVHRSSLLLHGGRRQSPRSRRTTLEGLGVRCRRCPLQPEGVGSPWAETRRIAALRAPGSRSDGGRNDACTPAVMPLGPVGCGTRSPGSGRRRSAGGRPAWAWSSRRRRRVPRIGARAPRVANHDGAAGPTGAAWEPPARPTVTRPT